MLGPRTGRENIHTLVRPRRALAKQGGVLGTSMGAALPPWVTAPPLWAPAPLLWALALSWALDPPWGPFWALSLPLSTVRWARLPG